MKAHGAFDRIGDILSQVRHRCAERLCRTIHIYALFARMILSKKKFFSHEFFFTTPLDELNEDMIQFAQPLSEKGKSSGVKPGT